MANETKQDAAAAETPKKRRKPQGPRTVKPLHLLIKVTDENGEVLQITQEQVQIEVVKDPAVLLKMFTTGGMQGSVYKEFTPPVERPSPAAA